MDSKKLNLNSLHHISVICSDYQRSKVFYTEILGLEIMRETFREERQSYKLDLALNGKYVVELFSFPQPPKRPTRPEATGLRHLAFEINDITEAIEKLKNNQITTEDIRTDESTGKRFTFFPDPDGLPIELYEK